jgi:hypothetical protein
MRATASCCTSAPDTDTDTDTDTGSDTDACLQGGNVATAATPATSGGGSGSYGPTELNNGLLEASCSFCWISAGSSPGTAWMSYTWSTPQTLWGMWVDTQPATSSVCSTSGRSLDGGTIQYWNGASWIDVLTLSDMGDDWYPSSVPLEFAAPITTTQLRVYGVHADTLGSQQGNPMIFEWQVFDCL